MFMKQMRNITILLINPIGTERLGWLPFFVMTVSDGAVSDFC
jgi:hypothetical protein